MRATPDGPACSFGRSSDVRTSYAFSDVLRVFLRADLHDCARFCSVNSDVLDWIQSAFFIHVEDGTFFVSGPLASPTQGAALVPHQWSSHAGVRP